MIRKNRGRMGFVCLKEMGKSFEVMGLDPGD